MTEDQQAVLDVALMLRDKPRLLASARRDPDAFVRRHGKNLSPDAAEAVRLMLTLERVDATVSPRADAPRFWLGGVFP